MLEGPADATEVTLAMVASVAPALVRKKFRRDEGFVDMGFPPYPVIRRSLIRFPPRIASLSALLKKGALRTKSIPTGQSKG